jgi:hypothetical protein
LKTRVIQGVPPLLEENPMASITVPYADELATATHSKVAVRGRELARHYGQGDTVVHARRGGDHDLRPARRSGVLGPSGAGQ